MYIREKIRLFERQVFMTSSPNYNFGYFGGYDYNAIMSNPYFLMAANSPNVNFRANTEGANGAQYVNSVSDNNQNSVQQAVVSQPAEQEGGSNFVQGALALTLIGAGAYALFRGHKSGYLEKAWKKFTGKTDNKTVNTVLQNLTAVKNGNGEIKLMVPNKTKTFAGKNIQSGVNEYGIQQAVSESRQAFNPEISVPRSFHVTTPGNNYTVFIKDGEVTKVVSALMKKDEDVLARLVNAEAGSSDAQVLEKFKKIAEELGKKSEEADKTILKEVTNIRYSNQYGDDTLNMVMTKYGETPKLQSFKTLEQFDKVSEAVKQYTPSASEEVFAGNIINQTGGWLNKKGVLIDGLGVLKCNEEIVSGTRCFFEGDKLVKIVQGENTYTEGSFGFIDFVKKNEKAIEQFKKDVFVDKIAAKIPVGSIIGTV